MAIRKTIRPFNSRIRTIVRTIYVLLLRKRKNHQIRLNLIIYRLYIENWKTVLKHKLIPIVTTILQTW